MHTGVVRPSLYHTMLIPDDPSAYSGLGGRSWRAISRGTGNSDRKPLAVYLTIAIIAQIMYYEDILVNVPINYETSVMSQKIYIESANNETVTHINLDKLIPKHLTLAVTTLVLNQGKYLCEWIEIQKLMGFQLFIIFDDNSTDNTA